MPAAKSLTARLTITRDDGSTSFDLVADVTFNTVRGQWQAIAPAGDAPLGLKHAGFGVTVPDAVLACFANRFA